MMFLLSLNPAANEKGNSNRRDKGGEKLKVKGQAGASVVVVFFCFF